MHWCLHYICYTPIAVSLVNIFQIQIKNNHLIYEYDVQFINYFVSWVSILHEIIFCYCSWYITNIITQYWKQTTRHNRSVCQFIFLSWSSLFTSNMPHFLNCLLVTKQITRSIYSNAEKINKPSKPTNFISFSMLQSRGLLRVESRAITSRSHRKFSEPRDFCWEFCNHSKYKAILTAALLSRRLSIHHTQFPSLET